MVELPFKEKVRLKERRFGFRRSGLQKVKRSFDGFGEGIVDAVCAHKPASLGPTDYTLRAKSVPNEVSYRLIRSN